MQGVRIRSEKAGRKFYKSRFGMIRIGQQCSRSGRACRSSVLIPFSLWIYTMNRCRKLLLPLVLAAFAGTLPAQTQTVKRGFPPHALRGTLVVTAPPEVTLDGKADRLSPGSRIRNTQNTLALSASLVGQELTVNYARDAAGLLHEVWILTDSEAAEKRPTAADLARR